MAVNSAVGIIYMASNIKNGKVYIGKTVTTLDARKWQHEHKRSNCTYFKRAIEKYGKDSFRWEVIDSGRSLEQLNQLENWWIEYMGSANPANGYNLMTGGQGSRHSDETRKKISYSLKGVTKSEETKRNISMAVAEIHRKRREKTGRETHEWKLPPISEETRAKLSESRKGRPAWNKGKKASEAAKRNMSIAHIGQSRPQSEETKRKLQVIVTEWHRQRKEPLQKGA